ncbi:hypothetical protein BY458DRAFT_528882, partial [Sporodiniella umbellata]
ALMVLTTCYSYLVWPSGLVSFGQTLNIHMHTVARFLCLQGRFKWTLANKLVLQRV